MVDIHSHLLPDVDDGCPSYENSLELIKKVSVQGVTDVVLTPHHRREYNATPQELQEKFSILSDKIKQSGLNVRVYLGQEIFIEKDYKSLLLNDKVLSMNGGKFVLVEFAFEYSCDIINTVYELKMMGYEPIVAHVERYGYADITTVEQIKEEGGYVQVNAQSIVQNCPLKQKKFIKQLFKNNLVDFVASDMHSERKYLMAKAFNKVQRWCGKKVANAVFNENAKKIITGQS